MERGRPDPQGADVRPEQQEGNHGEDVKEYWFYLDSTPTHSYLKCQYKYPQRAFPYDELVSTNARRGKLDMEYELLDTGIFDDDRYFDVVVEYAKATHEDIVMRVTAHNRGPDPATLHLLPTLWFRNTWSWGDEVEKPVLGAVDDAPGIAALRAAHPELGEWLLRADDAAQLLFCENETNNRAPVRRTQRLGVRQGRDRPIRGRGRGRRGQPRADGHQGGRPLHVLTIAAGESASIRLRLTAVGRRAAAEARQAAPLGAGSRPRARSAPSRGGRVLRDGDPRGAARRRGDGDAPGPGRDCCGASSTTSTTSTGGCASTASTRGIPTRPASSVRNVPWFHMVAADVISMPDKWEYPWFAAWDLAFHCAPLSLVDVDFAKQQVELLLTTRYLHPNGQIPAYEWNFSDVNPPVTAWAALYVYEREAEIRGGRRR